MTKPPEYDSTKNHALEPIQISQDPLIILISKTEQPAALNMRMVQKNNNEDDSVNNTDNDTNDNINKQSTEKELE